MSIEGYNNQYRMSDEAQNNILRNIRQMWPELNHLSDADIMNKHDEWMMSGQDETFIQWCKGD